jgi:hypothetical protein
MTPSARQVQALALERLDEWAVADTNTAQWFVWGGGERALWQQFLDRWPLTEQIERITVVSPFWSEEHERGPITLFVTALKERGHLIPDAELVLLTEAAADTQMTYKPQLPVSFHDFDARVLGVAAKALAVDPRVPPEEVGMGEEFTGIRSLHAKVVLLEGGHISLLFIGSANFTRHGWGFLADPRGANIEAGLIVRRSGPARSLLHDLIPTPTGSAVPLASAAAGRLALPDPSPDELPWPTFLREVVLAPSENDPEQLDLVVHVTDLIEGPWRIAHLPTEDSYKQTLLVVEHPEPGIPNYRVSLGTDSLGRLLRGQEVLVEWWQYSEGRPFPLNVAVSARTTLPISPGTGHPQEQHLIAYYQGRITWEELFPDSEATAGQRTDYHDSDTLSGVDTSRIQSYIVREFVEALKGIMDDLQAAAMSSKARMRLALLGAVSPVALAARVMEAAQTRERTPVAAGFQLVEILGCLDAARHCAAAPLFRTDWLLLIDEARRRVVAMLDTLQQRCPEDLSPDFWRYAQAIRQQHREELVKG